MASEYAFQGYTNKLECKTNSKHDQFVRNLSKLLKEYFKNIPLPFLLNDIKNTCYDPYYDEISDTSFKVMENFMKLFCDSSIKLRMALLGFSNATRLRGKVAQKASENVEISRIPKRINVSFDVENDHVFREYKGKVEDLDKDEILEYIKKAGENMQIPTKPITPVHLELRGDKLEVMTADCNAIFICCRMIRKALRYFDKASKGVPSTNKTKNMILKCGCNPKLFDKIEDFLLIHVRPLYSQDENTYKRVREDPDSINIKLSNDDNGICKNRIAAFNRSPYGPGHVSYPDSGYGTSTRTSAVYSNSVNTSTIKHEETSDAASVFTFRKSSDICSDTNSIFSLDLKGSINSKKDTKIFEGQEYLQKMVLPTRHHSKVATAPHENFKASEEYLQKEASPVLHSSEVFAAFDRTYSVPEEYHNSEVVTRLHKTSNIPEKYLQENELPSRHGSGIPIGLHETVDVLQNCQQDTVSPARHRPEVTFESRRSSNIPEGSYDLSSWKKDVDTNVNERTSHMVPDTTIMQPPNIPLNRNESNGIRYANMKAGAPETILLNGVHVPNIFALDLRELIQRKCAAKTGF